MPFNTFSNKVDPNPSCSSCKSCLIRFYSVCLWKYDYDMGLGVRKPLEGCEQHRRRPAFTSAQSDQLLCFSLFWKYHIQTCYKRNLNFLASPCNWGDWFESCFVGNPEDRFCHIAAHMMWVCTVCQSNGNWQFPIYKGSIFKIAFFQNV